MWPRKKEPAPVIPLFLVPDEKMPELEDEPPYEAPVEEAQEPLMPTFYHGRMYSDEGNLFADEDPYQGLELRHEPGQGFVFVKEGEAGHFETHHHNFKQVVRTDVGESHHFSPEPEDPNFDGEGNLKYLADHVAAVRSGHTDFYEPNADRS